MVKSTGKSFEAELVRGWLHEPDQAPRASIALFHGAGSNCEAPLLVAAAEAFREAGWLAFRGDLPYRQLRRTGPPSGNAKRDRDGIRRAAEELSVLAPGVPLCLAGHSYGGRQCSMLLAEDQSIARGLLLFSYPLHPPNQPAKARTEHLASLRTPTVFVHGTRDPFGTIVELEAAISLIPAKTKLVVIEGAPHGVPPSAAASLPTLLWEIMNEDAEGAS